MRLRVLTVADLHQSRKHFQWLRDEVKSKRPDLVAFVGDVLIDSGGSGGDQVRTEEAARILSGLCCPHLVARAYACNPEWTKAIERFRPLLTVSGHDHETPKRYNAWHGQLGDTVCVNVGRGVMALHFCVLDFEFPQSQPCLPTRIEVEAFPWKSKVVIEPK